MVDKTQVTIKSQLMPFVVYVTGDEESVESFLDLLKDSSDLSGYCLEAQYGSDGVIYDDVSSAFTYRLKGRNIFELDKAYRALMIQHDMLDAAYRRVLKERNLAIESVKQFAETPKAKQIQTAYDNGWNDCKEAVIDAIDEFEQPKHTWEGN